PPASQIQERVSGPVYREGPAIERWPAWLGQAPERELRQMVEGERVHRPAEQGVTPERDGVGDALAVVGDARPVVDAPRVLHQDVEIRGVGGGGDHYAVFLVAPVQLCHLRAVDEDDSVVP